MNVEIWAEAALFPEKEYISGIFVAVFGFPDWGPLAEDSATKLKRADPPPKN
jgi:hypothetical protein